MKHIKISPRTLLTISLLMGGMGNASASMITEWSYYGEAGFSSYAPFAVSATGNSGAELGLATTLSWGTPSTNAGQSQLVSSGNVLGTAFTNGGPNSGTSLTHFNRIIYDDGAILESATLETRLLLTPIAPMGPALPAREISFDIVFTETPNEAMVCADGTPNYQGMNINGCADIFVLTNPASLVDSFQIGNYLYTVSLWAEGLGPLSSTGCSAVGQDPGCVGFLTIENQSNSLSPYFSITAERVPVPAPGTLLLMGIGLLALRAARR